jgi:hypothetical protein
MTLSEIKKKLEQDLEKLKEEGKDVVEVSKQLEITSLLVSIIDELNDLIFLKRYFVEEEAKHRHKKGK